MSVSYEDYTEYDWFGEARCLESSGEFEKALKAFDESIKLNPDFAKAWYYKAVLLYRLGRKDEAAECSKKVVELKPEWEKYIQKEMPDIKL